MTQIKESYTHWMLEKLTRQNQIRFLGAVIWLKWCEDLHRPLPDLKAPAGWTSPTFFLVGLAGDKYYRLSSWWVELQIRRALRMMEVE